MKNTFVVILLGTALVWCQNLLAQDSSEAAPTGGHAAQFAPRSIEDLNLVGADIHMPPFSDTVFGVDSPYRRALYSKGFVLRANTTVSYTQNTLNPPVPAAQQAYVGERPFWRLMVNPMLTYDMRAFHLHGAQLHIGTAPTWVSWGLAGPSAVGISNLYLFKSFAEGRVETKFGYVSNDFEFLALQVGGALTTGSQGVYAILPYEVGLNHTPVPSPSFNLKLNGPKQLYFRGAVQRSIDPGGGPATIARNATGLRFLVKGDKMVNVYEVGYNHPPLAASHESWVRAGYIRNTTPFPNSRTGIPTPGNFSAYILADHQFLQSNRTRPGQGIYAGASTIGDSTDLNAYTRYYEFRLYDEGPSPSRPSDTISLVASHSDFSRYTVAALAAQGESFWRNSSSLTVSYNIRISRGNYVGTGLSYVAGPAITPRVPNALTFTITSTMFF